MCLQSVSKNERPFSKIRFKLFQGLLMVTIIQQIKSLNSSITGSIDHLSRTYFHVVNDRRNFRTTKTNVIVHSFLLKFLTFYFFEYLKIHCFLKTFNEGRHYLFFHLFVQTCFGKNLVLQLIKLNKNTRMNSEITNHGNSILLRLTVVENMKHFTIKFKPAFC